MIDEPVPTNPEPAPDPHGGGDPKASGPRRVKRRLMLTAIGLYALGLAAAGISLVRGPSPSGPKTDGKPKSLLPRVERDVVGWLSIHGPIYSSEDGRLWDKGVELWVRKLKQMSETKGIKAIVLDINSPGGSVGATQELYSQILRIRKEKNIPIVALFGDVAASGGYYIASACDKIVAHPGTLTGSIGVLFRVSNMEGLFSKIGFKLEPIKSGKHKDIGSPSRPMTPEERAILQALVDDAYQQFVAAVSAGRKLPEEQVRTLADGRIYSGTQALEAKLVDALGDSTDAAELAGKLGGIEGRPKVRRDMERFGDFLDLFDGGLQGLLRLTSRTSLLENIQPRLGLEYRWPGW
ncbi:MAG: signal peptide peptidase SppA [Elusimicrobia bacterium]|nr:signal peptide peptidase SppA [Elusimicrobiota bacterium]